MYFFKRKTIEIILLFAAITCLCIYLTGHILNSVKNVKQNYPKYNNVLQNTIDNYTEEEEEEELLKDRLKIILNCCDRKLVMKTNQYGQYWLLENYVRGGLSVNMECSESITYVANADYTYMGNLSTVVKRWAAPISFALYAPGYDYNATMDSIQYARNCLPESQLIRDYVTFHIYFPHDHPPPYVAINEDEALKWNYDCDVDEAPYENVNHSVLYKTQQNLTYPINVGRNIARKAVNTYFILASDIELFPSLNMAQQFLEMIANNATEILKNDKPKVFPLPVFELKENITLPNSKEELKKLLDTKMALPFHFNRCRNCHMIPKYDEWLETNDTNDLQVLTVAKRQGKYGAWEPFYISDNKEPLFDERFSWEGQSDKRIQNYAMCLMDYEYHVLDPAYLVHSPGIKKLDFKSEVTKKRMQYISDTNNLMHHKIIPQYLLLYGNKTQCQV